MNQSRKANFRKACLGIIVAVLVLGLFAYRNRRQIEAKVWHWRHGYTYGVGEYDVFIPDHWLPKRSDIPDNLLLYDTKSGSGVRIFLLPGLHELEFWETKHRQKLEKDHVKEIVDHTLNIVGQEVICVGGTEFQDELKLSAPNIISLDCESTGNLHLMFVGKDSELGTFYGLASRIKERR